MSLYKNLILIYGILPYILNIGNKWGFMISLLFGNKNYKIKIDNYLCHIINANWVFHYSHNSTCDFSPVFRFSRCN